MKILNKIYTIASLVIASSAIASIQVIQSTYSYDNNKNTSFNAIEGVQVMAGQKLVLTINQEASDDINIMSVKYGNQDFTLAVCDDGSNFKMSEIWYLDVLQDQTADVVVRYCDTSSGSPVSVNARSAVALLKLSGAASGGPVTTYTRSRVQPVIPTAVAFEFAAGKGPALVVGAYVQNSGRGQPQNPIQFNSVLTSDCGSSNAAAGYCVVAQSTAVNYEWKAPAGLEINPDNAVAIASFAARAHK